MLPTTRATFARKRRMMVGPLTSSSAKGCCSLAAILRSSPSSSCSHRLLALRDAVPARPGHARQPCGCWERLVLLPALIAQAGVCSASPPSPNRCPTTLWVAGRRYTADQPRSVCGLWTASPRDVGGDWAKAAGRLMPAARRQAIACARAPPPLAANPRRGDLDQLDACGPILYRSRRVGARESALRDSEAADDAGGSDPVVVGTAVLRYYPRVTLSGRFHCSPHHPAPRSTRPQTCSTSCGC